MQVALASAHAVEGPLAGDDYEGTVRDFQTWLAAQDAKLPPPRVLTGLGSNNLVFYPFK
jgi:hypothetical protein